MKERIKRTYNLDNSAIMHMATLRKDHANSFRIVYTLKEAVRPEILQEAINNITPRFPTIIAGVKNGFFRHLFRVPNQAEERKNFSAKG